MLKMGDIVVDYDNMHYVVCASVQYRGREYAYITEKNHPQNCNIVRVDADGLKEIRNQHVFNNIMSALIKYIDFNGLVNNLK